MEPASERPLVLVVLFGSTLVIIIALLALPNAQERLMAWRMGGVYEGNIGVLMQKGRNNCGPTALSMIFNYYGIQSTVQEIERTVLVTERGSTMLGLKEFSAIKGLPAEGWRLTLNDLSRARFPLLLFIEGGHYVVADSLRDHEVFLRDPAVGRIRIPARKLARIWKGETLLFGKK